MLNGEQSKLHNGFIRPPPEVPKSHPRSTFPAVVKSAGEADAKQTGESMALAYPVGHKTVLVEGCAQRPPPHQPTVRSTASL